MTTLEARTKTPLCFTEWSDAALKAQIRQTDPAEWEAVAQEHLSQADTYSNSDEVRRYAAQIMRVLATL